MNLILCKGFERINGFLSLNEIKDLEAILRKFHRGWLVKNQEFYQSQKLINSAYLTSGEFLTANERFQLLRFVGSQKLVNAAKSILGEKVLFLNTQLFFDPWSDVQKNYWHRDIQYTGKSLEDQKKSIEAKKIEVLHLRLAITDERGIEFIPYSHFKWDNNVELDVRLERNQRTSFQALEGAEIVSLRTGDLLLFDANIIHRGLYGGSRFSFDILFCKPEEEFIRYIDQKVYPSEEELSQIECPDVFKF